MLRAVSIGAASAVPPAAPVTEYGQFTVQMTGLNPVIPSTFKWCLIAGSFAVITSTGNGLATSTANILEIPAGTLPLAIRPHFSPTVPCLVVNNNQSLVGRAAIPSIGAGMEGGVIFGCPNVDGLVQDNGFLDLGLKGLLIGITFMYPLWP